MAGKHEKFRSSHGSTPRGPRRWERAAANALVKPNSQAGRLYLQRVSLAYQVSEECRNSMDVSPDQAYEHLGLEYKAGERVERRKYLTCSVFCTVMVVQLDHEEGSLEAISNVFSTNHRTYNHKTGAWEDSGIPKVRPLNKGDLTRSARCYYCGSMFGPKK